MEIIKKFSNNNYELQAIDINNTIYFKGNEIASILGYKNPKKAIYDHVDEDDKEFLKELIKKSGLQNGAPRKFDKYELGTLWINESGLYSLILSSKLKEAKEFKKWVTSEVLPSIRKTGEYKIPKISESEQRLKELSMALDIFERINMVDDSIKSIMYSESKSIANKGHINNTSEDGISDEVDYPLTRRLKDLGYSYSSKRDKGKLMNAGKMLSKLYYIKHEEKPKKRNAYVDGQLREINFYTKEDFDIMDEAIETYFNDNSDEE
jgi:prophage antirepressor-like protein